MAYTTSTKGESSSACATRSASRRWPYCRSPCQSRRTEQARKKTPLRPMTRSGRLRSKTRMVCFSLVVVVAVRAAAQHQEQMAGGIPGGRVDEEADAVRVYGILIPLGVAAGCPIRTRAAVPRPRAGSGRSTCRKLDLLEPLRPASTVQPASPCRAGPAAREPAGRTTPLAPALLGGFGQLTRPPSRSNSRRPMNACSERRTTSSPRKGRWRPYQDPVDWTHSCRCRFNQRPRGVLRA